MIYLVKKIKWKWDSKIGKVIPKINKVRLRKQLFKLKKLVNLKKMNLLNCDEKKYIYIYKFIYDGIKFVTIYDIYIIMLIIFFKF
jgi:hypothetical protein